MENLSLNIRLRRTAKHITQAKLADLLTNDYGIITSQTTICRFESGVIEPNASQLVALSGIFDCSIEALLLPIEAHL